MPLAKTVEFLLSSTTIFGAIHILLLGSYMGMPYPTYDTLSLLEPHNGMGLYNTQSSYRWGSKGLALDKASPCIFTNKKCKEKYMAIAYYQRKTLCERRYEDCVLYNPIPLREQGARACHKLVIGNQHV